MTNQLVSEPVRTHLVTVEHGAQISIRSKEGDDCVLMGWGETSTQITAEECEALASVLMAHAERLTRRVGA